MFLAEYSAEPPRICTFNSSTMPVIQKLIKTEIFECKIFMICKVLTKFTKILFHEYLEPYGNLSQTHSDVFFRLKTV